MTQNAQEDIVTPYEVKSVSDKGIDYDKLIQQFGCDLITDEQLKRFENLTGKKPHHFFRRKLFFSQRDFSNILDSYERSKKDPHLKSPGFFLYTGRGPSSSSIHIGHLIPLIMTQYLQETFGAPLLLMMSDDEKFFTKDISFEDIQKMTYSNIKDIIALGFCKEKTYIFSNIKSMGENPDYYPLTCKIQKHISVHRTKKVFGFKDTDNIGLYSYTANQVCPSYAQFMTNSLDNSMPCLIPCAIDQDPFFRTSRDIASKLGAEKPSLLHCKFIPGLGGYNSKMSSSHPDANILMTDSPDEIRRKIKQYAFSGGQITAEEHRAKGADCDVDVSFAYIKYFLDDDEKLEQIRKDYSSGQMLTSEIKEICCNYLISYITEFQKKRSQVTDEDVFNIMKYRVLKY